MGTQGHKALEAYTRHWHSVLSSTPVGQRPEQVLEAGSRLGNWTSPVMLPDSCPVTVQRAWGQGDGGHHSALQAVGNSSATQGTGSGQEGDLQEGLQRTLRGFKGSSGQVVNFQLQSFSDLPKINIIVIKRQACWDVTTLNAVQFLHRHRAGEKSLSPYRAQQRRRGEGWRR